MLASFYKDSNVPKDQQIPAEKDILLVVPQKGYDLSGFFKAVGVSPYEVAVTWTKEGVDLQSEIFAAEAKVVVQVDQAFSRKFPVLNVANPDPLVVSKIQNAAERFVGLHHHDEYSIKDGLGTVDNLLELLKAQRRSFCSITNHGSVGGWIKQYNACKKAGVKAIFGMEAYVSDYRGDDAEQKKAHRSANHLVLIATSKEGFDNIIRIHNDAQINGFYYTPRVNWAALEKWGKGIVASTACMAGEIPKALMNNDEVKAKTVWEFYSKVFDKVYLELQIIESEDQREANRRLIKFGQSVGASFILTNDSHYLDPTYSETHDMLMLIRQKKTIMDKMEKDDVWDFDVKNLFYRDADSMRACFENGFQVGGVQKPPFKDDVFTEEIFRDAMVNTLVVARGTETIKLDSTIKLPKLYPDSKGILKAKINAGFEIFGFGSRPNAQEYYDRIKYEYEIIVRLGWADYFLVMERLISDTIAKYGEWAIGYGRGCFHPSMRVVTGSGFPKFIGEVKKGDVVISHDGTKQKVLETFSYDVDEDLVEIEMSDGKVVRCTEDHKILVNKADGKEWIEAKNLKEGDDIVEVA